MTAAIPKDLPPQIEIHVEYGYDLYPGLSSPPILGLHVVLTAIIWIGGPVTMYIMHEALNRVQFDLVVYDIMNMGLHLLTVVYFAFCSGSTLLR